MVRYIRKLPGFRSGSKIKAFIATCVYGLISLVLLVIIVPQDPSLAVISPDPTNQDELILSGEALFTSRVYLLNHDGEEIDSMSPNHESEFQLLAKDLQQGVNIFTIRACDDKEKCVEERVLITKVTSILGETDEIYAIVTRVIDGDTIELATGETVRYIGIDTPETKHPSRPVECYGELAAQKNAELVLDKEVRLEKDVSETDQFGRLLRYVWIEENMVNDMLVREGFAHAASYPPDVKYQEMFTQAQEQARNENRGLWGECGVEPTPTPIPTLIPTPKPTSIPPAQPQGQTTAPVYTIAPTKPPVPTSSQAQYPCDCKKTCPNISSCEEAQYLLNVCGCTARDGDKDGIACDGPPLSCQ